MVAIGLQFDRFVELWTTTPCGAFPEIRKANLPPVSHSGESIRNCGRLTFTVQVTVWLNRFVGSLRTSAVLSLTTALTQLVPLANDCGGSVKPRLVAPGEGTAVGEPLHVQIVRGGLEQGQAEGQGLRGGDREVRAGGGKTIHRPNPLIDGQHKGLAANAAERDFDGIHKAIQFRTIPVGWVVLGALKQPNDIVAKVIVIRRGNGRAGGNPRVPFDQRTIRLLRSVRPLRGGSARIGVGVGVLIAQVGQHVAGLMRQHIGPRHLVEKIPSRGNGCLVKSIRAAEFGIIHQQHRELTVRHEGLEQRIHFALAVAVIGVSPVGRDCDQVTPIRGIDTVEVGVVGDGERGTQWNRTGWKRP